MDIDAAREPHSVLHHYAPLAFITVDSTNVTVSQLLRKTINVVAPI